MPPTRVVPHVISRLFPDVLELPWILGYLYHYIIARPYLIGLRLHNRWAAFGVAHHPRIAAFLRVLLPVLLTTVVVLGPAVVYLLSILATGSFHRIGTTLGRGVQQAGALGRALLEVPGRMVIYVFNLVSWLLSATLTGITVVCETAIATARLLINTTMAVIQWGVYGLLSLVKGIFNGICGAMWRTISSSFSLAKDGLQGIWGGLVRGIQSFGAGIESGVGRVIERLGVGYVSRASDDACHVLVKFGRMGMIASYKRYWSCSELGVREYFQSIRGVVTGCQSAIPDIQRCGDLLIEAINGAEEDILSYCRFRG